uniref:Glutamate--cysteine ligase regulatory subunit n=1 Tax=Oryzias latipes TaxID=8090 RepID=H2MRM2_ORYLA
MDPQNTEAKVLLSRAKTFRLHTGNLVNRSRLKKKCPGSTSEEVRSCQRRTAFSSKQCRPVLVRTGFPDVLDCSLPEATETITPEEREELKVSVKLFLCEAGQSAIGDAVDLACQTLAVSQLDSVIIAPPPPLEADQSLAHLQPAWEQLEALVRSQKIAAIGTSDLDKDLLEQLYNWAQVKPSSNQVNLASCCVMPPDLTAFAKDFDIQLLTHSDPKELMSAESFLEAMREGARDQSLSGWRLEWVLRYSVIVKSRGIFKSKGYLVSAKRVDP